jgi:diaminopimelate epimerase
MLEIAKAHAYGNDFLYVRADDVDRVDLPALARILCDRHTGIGADGLIVYTGDAAGAAMRLFNADGSRAEVSGNGVRALGALLLADDTRTAITITTDAGPKHLTRLGRDGTRQMFRTGMGQPVDLAQLAGVQAAGETLTLVTLSMGNPQCVVIGPLPDAARFERLGAALERHARFPGGTNVEFVHVEAPDRLRILIWERGVGPTTSSGTGTCAALVAAAAFGGASREADVIAPGGPQRVEWREDGVYLTGWAELICRATWLGSVPR